MKKAFTLAEIVICLMIVAIIAAILLKTIDPKKNEEKTNILSARKAVETVSQAITQMLDVETLKFPTRSFMVKPAGTSSFEYSGASSVDTASELITALGDYLKYETGTINFCDNTSYCSDTNIKGARLAGGTYFGIEKFSSVADCAAYRNPGDTTDTPAPTEFSRQTGTSVNKKCWGKLYIDVNGKEGTNALGADVYVYGLGEYGVER